MSSRGPLWIACAAGFACAAGTLAFGQVGDRAPAILHQDVRSPRSGQAAAGTSAPGLAPDVAPTAASQDTILSGDSDFGPGRNPAAFGTGEKILPEPQTSEPTVPEEPVLGRGGFGADRETSFRADDVTSADDDLRYVQQFNPSVVPFKRMTVLDAVTASFDLEVGDSSRADVVVSGEQTRGWDRFWGTVTVDLAPSVDVPLPSVAPGMRILSYEVEPRTQLTFSRDAADNFYVRSDETGVSGIHRLVFLVEADPGYFAPTVPQQTALRALVQMPERPRVAPLPTEVQKAARNVWRLLGIAPERDSLAGTLDTLIGHFRGFEPKQFLPSVGGLYWDLTYNQAGVCRHRSYAFVITALSLGIPARFVANEAHAFTEVWVPKSGWIRVDLGGASNSLTVAGSDGKSMYRPRGEDPFPQPTPYSVGGYSSLDGEVTGLTDRQIAESRSPRVASSDSNGAGDGAGDRDTAGGDDGTRGGDTANAGSTGGGDSSAWPTGGGTDDPGGALANDDPDGAFGPGRDRPPVSPEELRGKIPTHIDIASATSVAFRGETLAVEGIVEHDGTGIPGLRIDIYLAPSGQDGEGAERVGSAISGPNGRFRAEVSVPYSLSLADHEIFAGTAGDAKHQPFVTQ